jgi:hypothetical protein
LKNKALHSGCMSGHDGTEEDVDGDWVDKDDAALGEGGGGLGRKTKEAAMSEDGGDQTQIPKEAIFIIFLIIGACACKKKEPGMVPSALRGQHLHGSLVRAQTC